MSTGRIRDAIGEAHGISSWMDCPIAPATILVDDINQCIVEHTVRPRPDSWICLEPEPKPADEHVYSITYF